LKYNKTLKLQQNSYLIHVLLKNSNIFGERFLQYYKFFYKILFKNMNYTYEFTLKEWLKMKTKNFCGTKRLRNFLDRLKWKVDIVIVTKNKFNPFSLCIISCPSIFIFFVK